jgi:uncharacterized membrane protein YgcG
MLLLTCFALASCRSRSVDVKQYLTNDFVFVDQAKILTTEEQAELGRLLDAHNKGDRGKVSVLIIDHLKPTAPRDIQSFVDAKVDGRADRIVFVLSWEERRLKLAWSKEMGKVLSDEFRKKTVADVVGKFKERNYFGGIRTGVTALIHELQANQNTP